MKKSLFVCAIIVAAFFALSSFGQSPNNASLVVNVVDPNGAVIQGAKISLVSDATGATRNATADENGSATLSGLPVNGTYTLTVEATHFGKGVKNGIAFRVGETATIRIGLAVGLDHDPTITVIGTAEGIRNDAQIGKLVDSTQADETPILGRKFSTLPLLNSAFRQGKGTGDLFTNQTYFVTGVGSRRATTYTLDGANNDEGWGRQVATTTVPLGAVQEVNVMTNAFSSEFGWTSGPALNVITKSGGNKFHGDLVGMFRPGGSWQARSFSTTNYCPKSVSSTCVVPSTLQSILPVDIPDKLWQGSFAFGGPIKQDKTFFFLDFDRTAQNRTTFLSGTLPSFVLPANGDLSYTGRYRQSLLDARLDHKLNDKQNVMFRFNIDRFYDDNPQDAVGGSSAPSVARVYSRRSWTMQGNHTWVINSRLLNEIRVDYLHGDPVTQWQAQNLTTTYTRAGSVPFTIGQSREANIFSHQFQLADTLSWTTGKHYIRFGASIVRHESGGSGSEPGTASLGTFTFKSATTAPFGSLTLADVQNYTQPINFGISTYDLTQWLLTGFVQDKFRVSPTFTLDLGLRYDRQTLTDAKANFEPRIGFAWNPRGDVRTVIRGGYGMYYTQIRSNVVAGYLVNGLDGLTTYTATSGQTGFPTSLTAVPVNVDPKTIPASQLPARDITIRAGLKSFYEAQFAKYGLSFLPLEANYPDKLVNPRSQVLTVGFEREFHKGFFVGTDFVRQHLSNIDRTVDLNAASIFDRNAVGQLRTVAAANATRPILPANGGVRQVNVLMNLGVADYNGLQTQISYRGRSKWYGSLSYTLSKATNTSEPDGNGIAPNQPIITRLGEEERGPSLLDQRHRVVGQLSYRFPWDITAGTLMQFASARPFNSTTGVDNNGDGSNNDRPVINGAVIPKSFFRGTPTSEVAIFGEKRIRFNERMGLNLRIEGFNIFNHANMLGRGQTIYSVVSGGLDTAAVRTDFGAFTTTFFDATNTRAIPAFANIDPPRMFQLVARFSF